MSSDFHSDKVTYLEVMILSLASDTSSILSNEMVHFTIGRI